MEVDPASLRAAATSLHKESNKVDEWTRLGGANVVTQLSGLGAASLFTDADSASRQAKAVMQARMRELGNLLNISAAQYTGTDTDTADRLAKFSDLNSGDPHTGNGR
ncbi:type VII secretion target [Nocardia australiensis]|uniref:type VII secretion target n=1 Tax=Nocardia australiensis TaxID=2887191 RepID=UPI001D1529BE|nr:type VII secretion target [Nocardia australiensis]